MWIVFYFIHWSKFLQSLTPAFSFLKTIWFPKTAKPNLTTHQRCMKLWDTCFYKFGFKGLFFSILLSFSYKSYLIQASNLLISLFFSFFFEDLCPSLEWKGNINKKYNFIRKFLCIYVRLNKIFLGNTSLYISTRNACKIIMQTLQSYCISAHIHTCTYTVHAHTHTHNTQ